jgi:hypothetical protein
MPALRPLQPVLGRAPKRPPSIDSSEESGYHEVMNTAVLPHLELYDD